MIEIDLLPAPTPSASSPSVPKGAADEFASALQDAAGSEQDALGTSTTPETAGEEVPTAADADAEVAPAADPAATDALDPVEAVDPGAAIVSELLEGGAASDGEPAGEPVPAEESTPTLPIDLLALRAATTQAESSPTVEPEPDPTSETSAAVVPAVAAGDVPPTIATPETGVGEGDVTTGEPTVAPTIEPEPAAVPAPDAAADGTEEAVITAVAEPSFEAGPPEAVPADGTPDAPVTETDTTTDAAAAPAEPTATMVASSGPRSTPTAPAAVPPTAPEPVETVVPDSPSPTDLVGVEQIDAGTDTAAPMPNAAPASASTSASSATAMTAASEAIAPTLNATPAPAATTVDPTAAAEAAAAAELDIPTPPQQIAEALRDVRRLTDGSHRLSLQLYPEELGVVQLELAVRDGQLHLRAATELESTRRLLNASLPELRDQLADAGVSAGSLEVGPETAGRDGSRQDRSADAGRPVTGEDAPTATAASAAAPTPTAPGRLDVRL